MPVTRLNTSLLVKIILGILCLCGLVIHLSAARASLLNTDANCIAQGCVFLHNGPGGQWELYLLGGASGTPATLYASSASGAPPNPPVPVVMVPVELDTASLASPPTSSQGTFIGVDTNNDNRADDAVGQILDNNNSGYLDAGDSMLPFAIDQNTDIHLARNIGNAGNSAVYDYDSGLFDKNTFWVASNAPFDIFGRAVPTSQSGRWGNFLSNPVRLRLRAFIQRRQTSAAAPYQWGNRTRTVRCQESLTAQNMGSIMTVFSPVVQCNRRTMSNNPGATMQQQSYRIYMRYQSRDYDLARGVGDRSFQIEYQVFNP